MNGYQYTPKQIEYIRRELPGRSHAELTDMFNRRFGTSLSCRQITTAAKNRKIKCGRDTRFRPGDEPHNKGMLGFNSGNATRFRPGNLPASTKPVGSERVNRDGYIEVKVDEHRTWRCKHVVLWEDAHGPVPQGHVVVFGDGDRRNLRLENLLLVSRRQLAVMNKKGLFGGSAELTEAGRAVADLYMKMGERKREGRDANRRSADERIKEGALEEIHAARVGAAQHARRAGGNRGKR